METNDSSTRKPYAPPTVTDLGDATRKTKGIWGESWETYGKVYFDIGGPPDEDPPGGNT